MKAITPQQAIKGKVNTIPDVVIEVFNELINENMSHNRASFTQKEVAKRLVKRGLNRDEMFEKGWLDVEPIYQRAGWQVGYDKPGFNEDYEATFCFTVKRKTVYRATT